MLSDSVCEATHTHNSCFLQMFIFSHFSTVCLTSGPTDPFIQHVCFLLDVLLLYSTTLKIYIIYTLMLHSEFECFTSKKELFKVNNRNVLVT